MTKMIQLIEASKKVSEKMANKHTPFIYNEWYVAAFSEEINRELLGRRLLNRRVVLYRTLSGKAIALEDRCAHRSFPLSMGSLEDDDIRCGYHGFKYDSSGALIEVPSQKQCPQDIKTKQYKLVEKDSLAWIWLGDQNLADESQIPDLSWLESDQWSCSSGYFTHPGNYVSMHENLMDLTHIVYLHKSTLGKNAVDFAAAPFKTDFKEGHFKLIREVVPTVLSPIWADSTKLGYIDTAARISTSEFISPAYHKVTVYMYDTALPEAERKEFLIYTAHLLTPETDSSIHYFVGHGRDFHLDDKAMDESLHTQLFTAFQEDVVGLGALEKILDDKEDDFYEISVATDTPAVTTRMYLKRRADQEAS